MKSNTTSTDTDPTLVGSVLRFGSADEVFLIESCGPVDESGKVLLRMSGLSGIAVERLVDLNLVTRAVTERVAREDFFVPREVCPLCSHTAKDSKHLFSVRQLFWNIEVRGCGRCGMAYKDPIANPRLLSHIYEQNYTHFVQKETSKDPLSVYRSRVERLGKVRGRHLDYGCGAGGFVEAALQAGWDSYGGDPFLPTQSASSPLAGRLFRIDASNVSAEKVGGKFDCISMWAVVEHLTSFKDTFGGLVHLLNPGGTIVFNSPNAHSLIAKRHGSSWRMATLIEHVQFCTPSAIRWLAKEWGLKVKTLRICGSPFPMGRGALLDQGLGSLPFSVQSVDDGQARPPAARPAGVPQRSGVMSSLRGFLLKTGGQTFGSGVARQLINVGRMGDHIEATLIRP